MSAAPQSTVCAFRLALVAGALGAAVFALGACEDKSVTLQKELASLRFEQQGVLDKLYQDYGQGELAGAVRQKAAVAGDAKAAQANTAEDKAVAKEFFSALSNAALEMDRSAFDGHCITLGKGERPSILSPRARKYFGKSDVKDTCHEVAQVQFSIAGKVAELRALGVDAS